ncbi:MAG: 5'-nucleotidase C-terminal domain-containing protein [Dysgonomonas sp.]
MKKYILPSMLLVFMFVACKQHYAVVSMTGIRTEMDATYDPATVTPMQLLVDGYKAQLDKEMNQVIGVAVQDMNLGRGESLLTNWTSDAMEKAGDKFTSGHCDLALMNVNGHRANLAKGNITLGNMYEIYSFDNALVLVKVKGSVLTEVFESYAKMGGAGISSSAHLEITKDGKLLSATVNGQPVDPKKTYSLVTLDYLAEGNDGMEALKKEDSVTPLGLLLRTYMIDYVKEQTKAGQQINSVLDGRITIKN